MKNVIRMTITKKSKELIKRLMKKKFIIPTSPPIDGSVEISTPVFDEIIANSMKNGGMKVKIDGTWYKWNE